MTSFSLKQLAAMTALNNMLSSSHFSISTIRDVGDMLDVNPRVSESYKILQTLHCVDWAKMPAELRKEVPNLIKDCLGVELNFQFKEDDFALPAKAITPQPAEAPKSRLRLLWRN